MKTILSFALLLAFASAAFTQALPDSAQRVLQQFEAEQAAARRKAALQLETAKQFEMRRGNLDGANAIQAKMTELTGGVPVAPLGTATAPAKPIVRQVQSKANAKYGGEIGAVKAGQSIKIQYVEGRWAMSGGSPDPLKWTSPDEHPYPGNQAGLYAVEAGEAVHLADIPLGTKRKPFRYKFVKDYEKVILRIRDSDPADNPGAAIYEVTLNP